MNIYEKIKKARWTLYEKDTFIGLLFQELDIFLNESVPTAAIGFNKTSRKYQILINPKFVEKITERNMYGVLLHELLHFCHNHINRFSAIQKEEWPLANIAMDMAINQLNDLLEYLPEGCVDVKNFKLADGKPFPTNRPAEEYFKLLQDKQTQEVNKPELDKYGANPLDVHSFEEMTEEERKELLNTFRRAIDKSDSGYSNLPEHIKDLLRTVEAELNGINYKKELASVLKRALPSPERVGTWKKPNKRFGKFARGLKNGELPSLGIYADTSGSISHTELNEFLAVVEGFLKAGARKCFFGMWHTDLYHKNKNFKLNTRFDQNQLEAGGTDVLPALLHVEESAHNLAIILTDGYLPENLPKRLKSDTQILWVISKQGNINHPGRHLGKTIQIK